MNAMDLVKAFGYIDDDLVFDAIEGNAAPEPAPAAGRVKQPKPDKPPRGGAKTKAIIIGVVAVVLAAAITCLVLYFTGVFGGKQIPIYTGMEISSVGATSSDDDANVISHKYSGDYIGRNDDIDKTSPFGDGNTTIEQQSASTLEVVSAGDTIYYANAGDDIYVAINFDNPDKYDIVSFSLSDGTKTYDFSGLLGNFEDGSTYEQIIIKLNVGTTGGIIEYSISKIKYLDDNSVNSDVIIGGETVVKCGVRTSDMTSATVTAETTTLTSISATVNVTDKYSLIDYSGGYIKAVLFDGSTIVHIKDLQLGSNSVVFDNLSPDTLYQYAIVGYYDSLNGEGVALNYLYTNTVYTPAIVLFDNIEITESSISFGYSWYTGYEGSITSLTLTDGDTTQTLSASETSAPDLDSYTDYTLTANYTAANGSSGSIMLEFKTEPLVEMSSISVANTSLVSEGDNIVIQADMYNPNGVTYSSVVVNGTEYSVSSVSTKTKLRIEITNNGQFAGGETALTITQITCTIDGETYTVSITENNTTSVFINGELTVENFSIARKNASDEYEETNYAFASDTLYYAISLSNATQYEVYSVTIGDTVYTSTNITMSSDYQTVYIPFSNDNSGVYSITLNSISYSNIGLDKTKTTALTAKYIQLSNNDIVEISTADQLLELDGYKYYKLVNNIDLSGKEWVNKNNNMYGIFDGGGYTISNIGSVTTYTDTDLKLGLFNEVIGYVTNLNIDNALYMVNLENTTSSTYNVYGGGIAVSGEILELSDINIELSVQITTDGNLGTIQLGGLMGSASVNTTENVNCEFVVSLNLNNAPGINIGGLYGNYTGISMGSNYGTIDNAVVSMNISMSGTVSSNNIEGYANIGGVMGYSYFNSLTISNTSIDVDLNTTLKKCSMYIAGILGRYGYEGKLYLNKVNSSFVADIGTDVGCATGTKYIGVTYFAYGDQPGVTVYETDCNASKLIYQNSQLILSQ